jgi:hypothetical protein
MTYSVMWTLTPVGYVPGGTNRLLLNLVASLRVDDARPILGDSPLRDWPRAVSGFGPWHVKVSGESAPRPAIVRSPAPESELWKTIFAETTRVDARKVIPDALPITPFPASFADAASALDQLFQSTSGQTGSELRTDSLTMRAVQAMADGSDAFRTDPAARAVADPIVSFARALRTRPGDPRKRRLGKAAPLDPIPAVERADFHQVVGLLINHPTLARAVGLLLTLEIDAFDDERLVRACGADGRPFQGEVAVRQPWSRVVATPGKRRFVMAAQRSHTPEVIDGMLDVASPERAREYMLTSLDVPGLSNQLEAHARAVQAEADIAGRVPGGGLKQRLPVRHDVGYTLARRNRPATVIRTGITRAQQLADPTSEAEQFEGAPVLYADDVNVGFRLDVSTDGGLFTSVMHRQVDYRVGARELTTIEEGRIEGAVGVQQEDSEGDVTLRAGEEVAAWDGWAIAVPRPGPKVAAQPGAPSPVEIIQPDQIPGYHIDIRLKPARGTLPRLRYGRTYSVRLRSVDLSGASIDPDAIDPAQRIDAGRYLRHQAAPGPYVLPRRRYQPGESNDRLVVRSDAQGCERHLAPPQAAFSLCELHGVFDAAFGTGDRVEARARMLALARREQGSFLDPQVLTSNGTTVPAAGIALVTNDPATVPDVTLPIPRGDVLPNGVYVIHDTDRLLTPYLHDPIVTGVTLSGLGALAPVTAAYRGTSWPERQPIRLIARPTSKTDPDLAVRVINSDLVIFVPPGFDGSFELSSALDPNRLAELAVGDSNPADVIAGLHLGLSARRLVSIVHPVKKPLAAPTQVGLIAINTRPGGVGITGTVTYQTHRATTGTVDVVATWSEHTDPGTGELLVEDRRITVGSSVVDLESTEPTKVGFVHDFADTRHRTVAYRGVAATRFAEYFPRVVPGDDSQRIEGQPQEVSILSRSRPRPPQVHSVVPLFTNTTSTSGNVIKKERKHAGFRVYLKRPWEQTGENERLGVVVPRDTAPAQNEPPVDAALMAAYVSRWGSDPIGKAADAAPVDLAALNFPNKITDESKQFLLIDDALAAKQQKARILSHAVQFDPHRRLWFADVAINLTLEEWPFVRLALVRYQPKSIAGHEISEIVVTDFAQLPPNRTVTAEKSGSFGVRVVFSGLKPQLNRQASGRGYSLRQERRMPEPLDTSLDLGSEVGIGAGWLVVDKPESQLQGSTLADLTLTWTGSGTPPLADELKVGRIVVEETVSGTALLQGGPTSRVVFTATFDRGQIGFN